MVAWSSIAIIVSAAVTVLAVPATLHRRVEPATVIEDCTVPGTVAFTFDDGPYEYFSELIEILDKNGAKGTFFFNGMFQNNPSIYHYESQIRAAYKNGHQIASHTWSHPDLMKLNQSQIDEEFSKINDVLRDMIGVAPRYMRPPNADIRDVIKAVARKYDQVLVLWNFDSGDGVNATVAQSNSFYDEVAKNYPDPMIANNHETQLTTVREVIPHAIEVLKKAGYTKFVTVAECLGDPLPYQS